jgi:cell division protein FtsW (lipid II flippase)
MSEQLLHRLWRRLVDHLDGPLLLITGALMLVGLSTVYSATYDASNRLYAQSLNMAVGLPRADGDVAGSRHARGAVA